MNSREKQNITKNLEGSVILFIDKKSNGKLAPNTEYNQTGIFISDSEIYFLRKRKIRKININELKDSRVLITKHNNHKLTPKIVNYFKNVTLNYRLFTLGIRALAENNVEVFNSDSIMPRFRSYMSEEEYNEAWSNLISKVKKGDLIFTFNNKSTISKLIASIDKGSWSHCAIYAGEGKIFEAISTGRVLRSIGVYKNKNIHLGVYRANKEATSSTESLLDSFIDEEQGSGYGYAKAIFLGIRTFLGLNDGCFEPTDVTPNGIIYSGSVYLVGYI